MTTLIARQPFEQLLMSSQRYPRRLSARLQEKEDTQPATSGYHSVRPSKATTASSNGAAARRMDDKVSLGKKRKIGAPALPTDYDEEDDGFVFTRAKTRKAKLSTAEPKGTPLSDVPLTEKPPPNMKPMPERVNADEGQAEPPKKKGRTRMSFSTPNVKQDKPLRRSKRLSDETERREGSPQRKVRKKEEDDRVIRNKRLQVEKAPEQNKTPGPVSVGIAGEDHSATKIALPFADTPVMRRNKAMREGKGGKGERRSSLGLRGRRASSLIDSGTSNALPHNEVEISDFYKHIESEGLPEPRRMKQLLTWCATRALGEKPSGTEFEYQSARLAARVMQEELLKDLTNRSEMSDWFNREEPVRPAIPLVKKPNPKNAQNAAKILELETQIKRLQDERQSLESLLRPPLIPPIPMQQFEAPRVPLDSTHLSQQDAALLEFLASEPAAPTSISSRLNSLSASLGPTIDAFADGIHKIGQYRNAAEGVASRVLGICATKLEEKDRESRRHALNLEEDGDTGNNSLVGVLRSLSKLER